MGTLMPGQVMPSAPAGGARPTVPVAGRPPVTSSSRVTNRLTSQQSSQQLHRLEHFCTVLRRRRHPVCPVNGILALLPFEMLKANDQEVAELERAISADISTIYNELQLRCPVTAVVVGMDQERGFRELIRRIGREDVAKQRFGQRFDVRTPATGEELRKFTSHVCGTFEDWVYTLFRQEEALSHPGNTALYALLCKVRRTLKTRLGDVLSKGFGYEPGGNKAPVLFSGCYFAATGPKSDRQAFVSGLLNKLYDEQEDIEWTNAALREDRRRGWLIWIGWGIAGAVGVGTLGWYFGKELPIFRSTKS
jgi:type VI protein secretion system component VasK